MPELGLQVGRITSLIKVEEHVLSRIGAELGSLAHRSPAGVVAIITDTQVGRLYGGTVQTSLVEAGVKAVDFAVPVGEASKSLDMAGRLYRWLGDCHVQRDGVVLALGGGMVSDLAGFVAATWMRGVRLVICPTTLEADVDACLGGKTAINLPGGKNLVGAFYPAVLVAVDPTCLRTLELRDVRAGLAESVKHALIASDEFLQWHEANAEAILALEDSVISELIFRNLQIKAGIVEQDPFEEQGIRERLNFGHTIGHAIEANCAGVLRHGECVALGMIAACRISRNLGMLDAETVRRLVSLLHRFELSTRLAQPIALEQILASIRKDKKVRCETQRFVLLSGLGQPVIRDDVPEERLREACTSLLHSPPELHGNRQGFE